MTSMPASRSVRAITLAPRSCPSRPTLATTTRVFRTTGRQYMAVRLTVVGSSPAWPNPGGAQSGYLIESGDGRLLLDCGPGVLARLRQLNGGWPDVDGVVVTHWHLDHWGDLVPWVWGAMAGPAQHRRQVRLWV